VSNLFISLPTKNTCNYPNRNTEPLGNVFSFLSTGIAHPSFRGLFARQKRSRVTCSSRHFFGVDAKVMSISGNPVGSPLCVSIPNVVQLSAEEKMIGADTRRIVTSMQNKQSIWNRSVGQFPRQSGGHSNTSTSRCAARRAKSPVPISCVSGSPNPAPLPSHDLRPETLDGVGVHEAPVAHRKGW
jgi:hypothetical protein